MKHFILVFTCLFLSVKLFGSSCLVYTQKYLKDVYNQTSAKNHFKKITSNYVKIYEKGSSLDEILSSETNGLFQYDPGFISYAKQSGLVSGGVLNKQEVMEFSCFNGEAPRASEEKIFRAGVRSKKREANKLSQKRVDKKQAAQKAFNSLSPFTVTSSFGAVGSESEGGQTLDMILSKLGLSYQRRVFKKYRLQAGVSLAKFFNIKFSNASTTGTSSFLPELSISLSKKFSGVSLGIAYDSLNYFLNSDFSSSQVSIDPELIHRLSVKSYYGLSPRVGLFANLGYFSSFEDVSGIDTSLGANLKIKPTSRWSFAPVLYYSKISVPSGTDSSIAYLLSISFRI